MENDPIYRDLLLIPPDKYDVRLEIYERGPGNSLGELVSEAHIQVVGVPMVEP